MFFAFVISQSWQGMVRLFLSCFPSTSQPMPIDVIHVLVKCLPEFDRKINSITRFTSLFSVAFMLCISYCGWHAVRSLLFCGAWLWTMNRQKWKRPNSEKWKLQKNGANNRTSASIFSSIFSSLRRTHNGNSIHEKFYRSSVELSGWLAYDIGIVNGSESKKYIHQR